MLAVYLTNCLNKRHFKTGMTFEKILKNIKNHVSLTAAESKYFTGLLQTHAVDKGEILLTAGQPCEYFYFVNDGVLRAYHLSPKGKESTLMFAMADWWITDMASFVKQAPALIYIEAVEAGEILRLHKQDMDLLLDQHPKFEKCFRVLFQNAYIREQVRSIENLTLTAEERYDRFVGKYPELCSKITQKQIASYLGITPEFLSAIRAQKR